MDVPGSSLLEIIQLGSILTLFWYFRNDFLKLIISKSKRRLDYFLYQRLLRSNLFDTISIVLLAWSIKFFTPYFF